MTLKPPTPVSKSFIVCRQVFQDVVTQEYILLGPTHQIGSFTYPLVANLSIFARCTSVQGSYKLELQLQDLEGEVMWRQPFERPLESQDPIAVAILNIQNQGIYFPRPGKYDLVLLANGEEVVRDVFWAHAGQMPPPERMSAGEE
jgi:hypothetical protein